MRGRAKLADGASPRIAALSVLRRPRVAVRDDDIENPTAESVGLDKGGAAGYLSIGYTYRFNTPLGSSPFVTLQ